MVKTRRSNGENGEVEDGIVSPNDGGTVSDEKGSNYSQRELRSSQYKVKRKIQHWPTKYSRRLRTIKMPRIMFPESDTEPEKYSRRSRQVRVFFADDNDTPNRSMRIKRNRTPRKNYMEDSEDKPIQQNVRRSCRKRKLLHHNFNESWITNELKVKGYPDLYGFPVTSSSDEFSSGDEARVPPKKLEGSSVPRRASSRGAKKNSLHGSRVFATESDSDEDKNQTVIEKPQAESTLKDEPVGEETMETDPAQPETKPNETGVMQADSESNQGPARGTRRRGRPRQKKDSQQDSASSSSSSESGSELTLATSRPRRSNRTRQTKPAFVQIADRAPTGRAKTFTIRKKPYSLRERKPKILRRKTIRAQSPSTSSSSSSSDSEEDLNVSMKNKTKGRQKTRSTDDKKTDRALREIQPVEVDGRVRFTSVGGLEEHIKCLREMVLFPLMYPALFNKFGTRPAKGVLFHGPPGTGKTLLARALANECTLLGGRKVAFFMRKGADCLKKWVGESERHLKLLFQQANKMKPSIIFFDEIDALAPVRSVRQEQVHTSVVGTLLAEMDGLCDRGEVVIIGATNRLDAVDPALRRAGRFDRELHFPPPHTAARRDILDIYTKNWVPKPSEDTLDYIAELAIGYGGSDIKALCSEAVLKALRRVYPQVYESEYALLIDSNNVQVTREDMLSAMKTLVAAASRSGACVPRALPAHVAPLLAAQTARATQILTSNMVTDSALCPTSLLITGPCADSFLAPAVLTQLETYTVKELSLSVLHTVSAYTQEQALISVFSECRRAERCVLYVADVVAVWDWLVVARHTPLLLQLWRSLPPASTVYLATSSLPYEDLPSELRELFPSYMECVYRVREPTASEVINFLKPVACEEPLQPPRVEITEPPPPLPRAPPPPPPVPSPTELARRKRQDDYKLRELRIFLRDICRKLASNRRFYKFTKPVDLEEVTDYLEIVKQPMDLETMMTKVDMHKYSCAKEFLDDVDLICANALEYNPDRTSSDKQIRHEACSLRDHAHALIEVEMDSDFELQCRDIARRRQEEGSDQDNDLPDFIYTASNLQVGLDSPATDNKTPRVTQNGDKSETHSAKRKRRRINAWSKGLVAKRPRTTPKTFKDVHLGITDEESKENKPIASTPLANGLASASDENSDSDAPLRAPSALHIAHNHVDNPTKSSERSPTKTSPKKRNSGHDTSCSDADKVLINKTELDNVLYKNAKSLRTLGLDALLRLHAQLSATLARYSAVRDRSKLPNEYSAIVHRYLQHCKK